MTKELIFAGFGGQGVILAGKILCIAAMKEDKCVSHIPSYGAEMRGGTANCSVVVTDEEIASPVVEHPDICIVLNKPSLDKFEPRMKEGGILIYNTSLIEKKPKRTDIKVYGIDCNRIAAENGSERAGNMVALGALVKIVPWLCSVDSFAFALDQAISARNKKFNEVNLKVIKAGYDLPLNAQ